jgi:hypothetical protein
MADVPEQPQRSIDLAAQKVSYAPSELETIARQQFAAHLTHSRDFYYGTDTFGQTGLFRTFEITHGDVRITYHKSFPWGDNESTTPEHAHVTHLINEYEANPKALYKLLDAFTRGPTYELLVQQIENDHGSVFEARVKRIVGIPVKLHGKESLSYALRVPVADVADYCAFWAHHGGRERKHAFAKDIRAGLEGNTFTKTELRSLKEIPAFLTLNRAFYAARQG